MTKIVICDSVGGFCLSNSNIKEYFKCKNLDVYFYEEDWDSETDITKYTYVKDIIEGKSYAYFTKFLGDIYLCEDRNKTWEEGIQFSSYWMDRDDPCLVNIIENIGQHKTEFSNDPELKVVEIPDDVDWDIGRSECGKEWVYEKHRIWE